MKKTVLFLICAIASLSVRAQDIITKSNGDEIAAKVLEVTPDNLKYKLWDFMDGPTYTILKSEILLVKYENGHKDIFANTAAAGNEHNCQTTVTENAETMNHESLKLNASGSVTPGMRYNQYKRLYNHREYVPEQGDRYSVGWGGWASFFIPGLGQMINGEGGRGVGYLLGSILCEAVTISGSNLVNGGMADIGAPILLSGLIALMAVDISAIVDGVRVAKIKNMYYQDLQLMKKYPEVNFTMQPYISTTGGRIGAVPDTPVAGVTLCMTF